MTTRCLHLDAVTKISGHRCLRGMSQDRRHMGPLKPVSHVRTRRSLQRSKNQHAQKHFHATSHPIITSIEPGETWSGVSWIRCFSRRWATTA
jgi:hypothetical protein